MLERLGGSLAAGGKGLEALLAATARAAAGPDGKLDGAVIDRHGAEMFRLAQNYAAWNAAREMERYAATGDLEGLLALAFGGQVLASLQEQLPAIARHLPGGGEAVARFARDGDTEAVIAAATGESFKGHLWEALKEYQSDGSDGLGEEHRLLKETFRAFADKKVRPLAERFHREDLLIPDDLIAEVSALGCFGVSIPQQYGGYQEKPDHLGVVVVTEELSRGALIFGSLITRPEILAKGLLKGGTEAQKKKFLPLLASGEKMAAISVTEPDFGSDVAGIATSARQADGGWRINGAKTFATFAGRAELIGLLVRTEADPALGHRGLSLFVVEKPAFYGHDFEHAPPGGGRLVGRSIATAGYRGMHSYELSFEDYLVPAENLIGGEEGRGRGFYYQMEGFAGGRLQTSGRALGIMQAAYEHAKNYARERTVFGKPLEAYALTREKLTTMAATVQACRQTAYATARLMDAGEGQMEASMTKFLLCREAEKVTREAQQLHGAMGYAEEFPLSRLFIDARVLSIFEGTEEVLALKVIAPALLKRYLD